MAGIHQKIVEDLIMYINSKMGVVSRLMLNEYNTGLFSIVALAIVFIITWLIFNAIRATFRVFVQNYCKRIF